MNGNHLPAGPGGGVGGPGLGGGRGPVDMGPGGPHSHNGGNGSRRRGPPHYPPHQHSYHHPQHVNPGQVYYSNSPMNPYASSYYPQVPPHYQNGVMAGQPYMPPYNPYPARSPPAIHQQYPPIVSSSMATHPHHPQPYSRPSQQPSPAVSTPPPYQTPALPPPVPIPQTPSSTHSSQVAPAPLTPPTPQVIQEAAPPPSEPEVITTRATDFKFPLPWLSHPDEPFPVKNPKSRRRRRILSTETGGVELPTNQQANIETLDEPSVHEESAATSVPETPTLKNTTVAQAPSTSADSAGRPETPSTQDLPSEDAPSTSPTTPVSVHTTHTTAASVTPTKPHKPVPRAAVPAVPIVPVLPKQSPKDVRSPPSVEKAAPEPTQAEQQPAADKATSGRTGSVDGASVDEHAGPTPAPVKAAPKLWTGLFSATAATAAAAAGVNGAATADASTTGSVEEGATTSNGSTVPGGFAKTNASSLAEALRAYRVTGGQKVAFLEPKGLINTGNMCYMNSVLQVLIFCVPFYDFLDQVSKKAAHSFGNSETPLIDAMINFMREYKVIDSAVNVEQLRRRLKNEELEQYGEAFIPEFVYEAIRKLPRFASMRRGHQQDAEEFLGFLLESLHDECSLVMRHLPEGSTNTTAVNSSTATPSALSSPTSTTDASDWLEVGRKQRSAITRSSGHPVSSSPITKIFGGQLRSELRVQGLKDSVTLEPYQPLQLDISPVQVHNIVDALKHLTRSETLHGDFNSPRGRDATAQKQVFIESLPSVLILHLKRFQFNAEGGTAKIWKNVGYPLELEIPKEVFSRQKRNALVAEGAGFPKYKLIAVVYHHGKNASTGHYTVDVRRQEGREWIRLDDTAIRRLRSEDVAEGGVEEDESKQAARSDNKKDNIVGGSGNRFEGIGDEENGDEEGWNQVSAPASGTKKWSSIVNGGANNTSTPAKGKQMKDNIRDNKVAYLLFYQRV